MSRTERLLMGVVFLGLTASLTVAALIWLLVTRPIALAEYLAQVF